MKTIGLIGGMSWESTAIYYQIINREVGERLGGLHSGKIVLYSVDFGEIEPLQRASKWDEAGEAMADAARRLERAGADCILICANTMHKLAPQVERAVDLPLLHIADVTAEAALAGGFRTVGLLGTRFTMEQDFYKDRLAEKHGLTVLTPDDADRDAVHEIIYQELTRGQVLEESRSRYVEVVNRLVERGAEAVILGCTEIPMLIGQDDVSIPLLDTTELHAVGAVDWALDAGQG